MTISAIGSASNAFSLLNSLGNSGGSAKPSAADTTTVTTAPDGTVTTTVTASNGTIISVAVTKPAATQNQAANGNVNTTPNANALLDVQV